MTHVRYDSSVWCSRLLHPVQANTVQASQYTTHWLVLSPLNVQCKCVWCQKQQAKTCDALGLGKKVIFMGLSRLPWGIWRQGLRYVSRVECLCEAQGAELSHAPIPQWRPAPLLEGGYRGVQVAALFRATCPPPPTSHQYQPAWDDLYTLSPGPRLIQAPARCNRLCFMIVNSRVVWVV